MEEKYIHHLHLRLRLGTPEPSMSGYSLAVIEIQENECVAAQRGHGHDHGMASDLGERRHHGHARVCLSKQRPWTGPDGAVGFVCLHKPPRSLCCMNSKVAWSQATGNEIEIRFSRTWHARAPKLLQCMGPLAQRRQTNGIFTCQA